MTNKTNPKNNLPETLGALKKSGYTSLSVKDEIRNNLIKKLQNRETVFPGIEGFQDTVIPDIQKAILSRHNILLLGLRGQAKTRIARLITGLLDEYIPVVEGSEINDDPLNPISRFAREKIQEEGDRTAIKWISREERFTEKLATPDISVADLIGDADPIKAANLKLPYADERVIHFGLIPRANRGIFVINELPDLQARIQVALFNILQESDIQIRGFRLRLPLNIQFVFTANPEDYTNRGSIVTPLKDRIDSQILTHYPPDIATSQKITMRESKLVEEQSKRVVNDEITGKLIEQIAFEARQSEYVDPKSGVSARLTISAYELLISSAEQRALMNDEEQVYIRIGDLSEVIPAITGKIELVYEGEQEGPANVARQLISKAIRSLFLDYFPNPDQIPREETKNPYKPIIDWFEKGNQLDLFNNLPEEKFRKALRSVTGLEKLVTKHYPDENERRQILLMEFLLHGLAEYSLLSKENIVSGSSFKDILSGMLR